MITWAWFAPRAGPARVAAPAAAEAFRFGSLSNETSAGSPKPSIGVVQAGGSGASGVLLGGLIRQMREMGMIVEVWRSFHFTPLPGSSIIDRLCLAI
jgi:hypothetical protein